MEKKICSYEALFTLNANLADDEIRATVDKFSALINSNASDVTINEWGKRRLAYPIGKTADGYMVLCTFKSESDFPRELERQLRIADSVLRVMITRKVATAVATAPAATAAVETAESVKADEAPAAEVAAEETKSSAPAQTTAE